MRPVETINMSLTLDGSAATFPVESYQACDDGTGVLVLAVNDLGQSAAVRIHSVEQAENIAKAAGQMAEWMKQAERDKKGRN